MEYAAPIESMGYTKEEAILRTKVTSPFFRFKHMPPAVRSTVKGLSPEFENSIIRDFYVRARDTAVDRFSIELVN